MLQPKKKPVFDPNQSFESVEDIKVQKQKPDFDPNQRFEAAPLKKKDVSVSSATKPELVSETTSGTSATTPQPNKQQKESIRNDGTKKQNGYLGHLKMLDGSGNDATEMSIGVEIDGKETEIPTLVPTLTKSEIDYLLKGGSPNDKGNSIAKTITKKAVDFAFSRKKEGKPYFADNGYYNNDNKQPKPKVATVPKAKPYNYDKAKQLTTDFRSNTSLNQNDEANIQSDLKTEEDNGGFFGSIKQGLISVANTASNFLGRLADANPEDIKAVQIDKRTPFQDQIKEVKQEAYKKQEKISDEEVMVRAKAKFVEKRKTDIYVDKANSYLDNLSQEDKKVLELDRYKDVTHLGQENNKRLKISATYKAEKKTKENEISKLQTTIDIFRSKNQPIPIEIRDEYNSRQVELNEIYKVANANYDAILKNKEDLGTANQEWDLFKRENRDWVNAGKTIATGFGELGAGLVDAGRWIASSTGLDNNFQEFKNEGEKSSIQLKELLEKKRELLRKPVESVESVEGFINYASDILSNQAPILAATSTGGIGLTMIGMSSAGQKYSDMEAEVRSGDASYSPLQMSLVPLIFGGSEVVSELPTFSILKKGGRVIAAARKTETDFIKRSAKEKAGEWAKDYGVDMTKELAGEEFTQFTQNFTEKYVLGKDDVNLLDGTGDVFKDTFTLTSILKVAPHILGGILKATQKKDQIKTLDENSRKLIELSKQLEDVVLTEVEKVVVKKKIEKITAESASIVKNSIKNVSEMPSELYQEVLSLNNKAGELKAQAKEISLNSELSNKEELIETLETEYKDIQKQRQAILEGKTSVIDVLPLAEKTKLKEQALEDLVTELNPDGTKDVTIDDAQITKRANEIYADSKANENNVENIPVTENQPQAKAEKVEELRAAEQVELKEALPNAELKADGKIDVEKLSTEDTVIYNKVYDKYDKLITPLLEDVVAPEVVAENVEGQGVSEEVEAVEKRRQEDLKEQQFNGLKTQEDLTNYNEGESSIVGQGFKEIRDDIVAAEKKGLISLKEKKLAQLKVGNWITGGLSLSEVSIKIRKEFGIKVSAGKWQLAENRRNEINAKYDAELEALKNEGQDANANPVDGNIQPGNDVQNSPQQNNDVQPAIDGQDVAGEDASKAIEEDEFDLLLSGEAEQRRKDGKYTKDGIEVVRQEPTKGPTGKADSVKFTDTDEVDFEYTLMEAEEVQPSHINGRRNGKFFITEAQPKNRKDDASKKASDKIGQNPKLKEVGENSNAYSGAPVVNERGEVIQGNNRAEGLKKHYGNNGKSYKEQLKAEAEKYGFTAEQIDGMNNPILVRKAKVSDEKAIQLGNFDVKDLETGGKRRLDPVTTSRRISKEKKAQLVDALFGNDSEITLNKAIRENFAKTITILRNYINDAQMQSIYNNDGTLSPKGAEDLEGLVRYFLFDGGNIDLVDQFESLSGHAKEAIFKSLPKILSVDKAKSILTELQNAVGLSHKFIKSEVGDFDLWLTQLDMFDQGNFTELEVTLARLIVNAKNQKELIGIFTKYNTLATDFKGDMFEEARPGLNKADAVKNTFNLKEYQDERNDRSPKEEVELVEPSGKGNEEGNAAEKPKSADQEVKPITKDSTADEALKWIENAKKNLDNLNDDNLSALIPIPILIAKGALNVMEVAIKAGKSISIAIKEAIDYLKQTPWYQNLSSTDQKSVEDNLLQTIGQNNRQETNLAAREASNNISEDEAYEKVDKAYTQSEKDLENKKTTKEIFKQFYRGYVKKFTDKQFLAKKLLAGSGITTVENLIINSHGASGQAKRVFQEAYDKIYQKLNGKERRMLDRVIQSRRIIAIDENRAKRGLDPVTHTGFTNDVDHKKFLSKVEKQIGAEKFADMNKRADEYFKTYKGLLTKMVENGLISQESFDAMDVEYQPKVYLQFVTDFNGDLETGNKKNNLDTGGLSSEQIKGMKEGDAGSAVLKSEWLLTNSLLARYKAMANNNINKRFMTDEYPKAKKRFDAIDPKNFKDSEEKRFYKYFKELSSKVIDNPVIGTTDAGNPKFLYDKTPPNFAKMYYYIDGKKNEFFLEKELHEVWNDNVNGVFSGNVKEFVSYAFGSALVKTIATGNNPAFPIVNTPRDLVFTAVFSKEYSKIVPIALLQVAKDAIQGVKEIYTQSDVVEKYFEYGGAMDFLSSQGRLKKNSVVGRLLEKSVDPRAKEVTKSIIKWATLHPISEYSELMFRVGIFQRSIKNQLKALKVKSISDISDKQQVDDIYNEAVASARGILDFNQGGAITKDLEALIPYINVAFQGGRVAANAFQRDPVGTSSRLLQVATITSGIPIGLSLLAIGYNKDDDDERSTHEIYLDAIEGVSNYKKSKYMIFITGKKDKDGQYEYFQIAKAQELTPVNALTDNIYNNVLRSITGQEKRSAGKITSDVLNVFNDNVMPLDFTSLNGLVARNPLIKANLTYATGYDFYRNEPLDNNLEKKPSPTEGLNRNSVEDFYKKIGINTGLSPIRSKAFVESLITSPDTNPFVGFLYGGAEAISSNKETKEMAGQLLKDLGRSTIKRMYGHTSDFNRQLENSILLEKKVEAIKLDDAILKMKFNVIAKDVIDKKITTRNAIEQIKGFDKEDRVKYMNKLKDRLRMKDLDGRILDIKYERSAAIKAAMVMHYFGDIMDKSKDSQDVINQLGRAKGILGPSFKAEYRKLRDELGKEAKTKKTP
jgi:hypothetical protein